MTSPIDARLRALVVRMAIEERLPHKTISEALMLSRRSVARILKREWDGPNERRLALASRSILQPQFPVGVCLLQEVQDNPTVFLRELQAMVLRRFNVTVGVSTIHRDRFLLRCDISTKKVH